MNCRNAALGAKETEMKRVVPYGKEILVIILFFSAPVVALGRLTFMEKTWREAERTGSVRVCEKLFEYYSDKNYSGQNVDRFLSCGKWAVIHGKSEDGCELMKTVLEKKMELDKLNEVYAECIGIVANLKKEKKACERFKNTKIAIICWNAYHDKHVIRNNSTKWWRHGTLTSE